jgi:8-oxo-dGTP pyrophosphatase MutT (NUDIX family)
MQQAVLDIDYSNFKNSVREKQGLKRESLCHDVWHVLHKLQPSDVSSQSERRPSKRAGVVAAKNPGTPIQPRTAYGGVLFNDQGQVLLVEPANHFDNTVWTWPKGKPDAEATAEAVALREVLEETGYRAEILALIPGAWKGITGQTQYFLMRPVGPQGRHHWETASTAWVAPEMAPASIQKTTKSSTRTRDLEVLAAALACYSEWKESRKEARI